MIKTPKKKINELPEATTVNDTDIMITQTTNSTPKTNKITMNTLLNKVKTWLLGVAPFSYVKNLTSDVQTQINQVNSNKADNSHTHAWSVITGKPSTFTPNAHTQGWDTITAKPTIYPPSVHNHDWATITGKPSTYTPASHNHDERYFTEVEINNLLKCSWDASSIQINTQGVSTSEVYSIKHHNMITITGYIVPKVSGTGLTLMTVQKYSPPLPVRFTATSYNAGYGTGVLVNNGSGAIIFDIPTTNVGYFFNFTYSIT